MNVVFVGLDKVLSRVEMECVPDKGEIVKICQRKFVVVNREWDLPSADTEDDETGEMVTVELFPVEYE